MTALVFGGVVLYFLGHVGFLLGIILLFGLLIYFTGELGLSISYWQQLILVASVMSLPLSCYLAGSYLDNYLKDKFSLELPLALVFLLFGTYLLLEQGLLLEQFEHTLGLISVSAKTSLLLILLEIISKIIMTTTGVMLIVLLISLIIIMPLAWLTKNTRLNFIWNIPSINLLLVFFLIASSYQLILSKLLA